MEVHNRDDLAELSNVVEITGSLSVDGIGGEDLDDLGSLVTVGDTLWIGRNPTLTSLSGLESLRTIGDRLAIWSNPKLASIDSLDDLRTVVGTVEVSGNSSLCRDEALALCDRFPSAECEVSTGNMGACE